MFAFYTGAVMTRMYLGTLETVLFVALTTTIEGFEDGFSHRRVGGMFSKSVMVR